MTKYIYPQIPGHDYFLFRIMGSGLANCLFVYARAIAKAKKTNCKIITPTWFNISIGPYLRHQSDKRHYLRLFEHHGEVSSFNKILKLIFCKKNIEVVRGLENYFADIIDDVDVIAPYIESHISHKILEKVNSYDFTNCVAVHIRLGDYPESYRTPIEWYIKQISRIGESKQYKFLIFSDGTKDELAPILSLPNTERAFLGNALADIIAISRCCYMIGSDSTFSGWGAFLGQVPCIFYRKHYGPVLKDSSKEIVEDSTNLWFK